MSGGAIFCLGSREQLADGNPTFNLVGILTEYNAKHRALVGTNARPMSDIFGRAAEPSTVTEPILSYITPDI